MKFGTGVQLDSIWVAPEGQGHRSKVRVTRSKSTIFLVFKVSLPHFRKGNNFEPLSVRGLVSEAILQYRLKIALIISTDYTLSEGIGSLDCTYNGPKLCVLFWRLIKV